MAVTAGNESRPPETLVQCTSNVSDSIVLDEPSAGIGSSMLIRLSYLDEGGANAIFTADPVDIRNRNEHNSIAYGKLLRLAKNGESNHNCEAIHQFFTAHVNSGFSETDLVDQVPIRLTTAVCDKIDATLRYLEAHHLRPTNRCGLFMQREGPVNGLLIADMRPSPGYGMFHFKPKWLSQSPTAPPNARRCRTCALRAQRNTAKIAQGQPTAQAFCPLALISRQRDVVRNVICRLCEHKQMVEGLTDYFTEGEGYQVLDKLRLQQVQNDSVGVLIPRASESLAIAMTYRDCSLYVRYPLNSPPDVTVQFEARLGDLDPKSMKKYSKWREDELALIEGGFYEGRGGIPVSGAECFLWRQCTIMNGEE